MCKPVYHVCSAHEGQRRALDFLEVELEDSKPLCRYWD